MAKESQRQLKQMYANLQRYAIELNDNRSASFHKQSIRSTGRRKRVAAKTDFKYSV